LIKEVSCAMTIAGSDSGCGAGIEADLKTFASLGVFGTCAITAVTAQNTLGIFEVFPVPARVVKSQIEAVLEDIEVRAVKTGMLCSKEIMEVVSEAIRRYGLNAVVDPVFQAGSGEPLIRKTDSQALTDLMVPRALVLTPNRDEAELIAKMEIRSLEEMKEAAENISSLGPKAVVIKGGHLEGDKVYDLLYFEGASKVFEKPRIEVKPHGGGCVFSSAIAGYLALGNDVANAVEKAEVLILEAVKYSFKVGGGRTPVNPMAHLNNEAERFRVLKDVADAVEVIEAHPEFLPWIAEVGTQVGMAVPYAANLDDVAAVEGRIVRLGKSATAVGCVKFGVSRHIARIILTVMKYDPKVRSAVNLRYDPRIVEAFIKTGSKVSSFDRTLEPAEKKLLEGETLAWGTEEAINRLGEVPDAIYDLGEVGKEPMIRVLGPSASETVKKALKALSYLRTEDNGE